MERGLAAAETHPHSEPESQRQASWLLRRDLAYVCWRMADLDPTRADAASLIRRAIELSEAALNFTSTEWQHLSARQNLLYYLFDLWEKLPPDRKQEMVPKGQKLLIEIRPKVEFKEWSIEALDSLVRAEVAFGERTRAQEAAKVVAERIAERIAEIRKERSFSLGQAFDALSRDDRDMYLYAQNLLTSTGH